MCTKGCGTNLYSMKDFKLDFTAEIVKEYNDYLRGKKPQEIADWAISIAQRPIVTTNFRPYEAAILQVCATAKHSIPVVWCDTGYNTPNTYKCADQIISQLNLKVDLYVPLQTSAYRDAIMGIPSIDDDNHSLFTEQVKLEPFNRAMKIHQPDVWFTNLRMGQTEHRNGLDILSVSKDGILKVSPFYYYTDEDLDSYMTENKLPNEFKYFDPTKALANRECGLHS